jgi:hypothetical protein
MERKLVNTSILFLLIAFTLGCSDGGPTISNEGSAAIIGKIVDSNGNPLEGVGVHYIPKLVGNAPTGFAKITPSTIISFTIPEPTELTVYILRYGSRDTVAVIMQDESVAAGNHAVEFSGDSLTNGVYIYVIEYDDKHYERKMLFLKNYHELWKAIPLAESSDEGSFTLPYDLLAIGEYFPRTSETDPTVIDSMFISSEITLVITRGENEFNLEDLVVDKFTTIEKTFTLPIN